MGKTFLTCTSPSLGTKIAQSQTPSRHLQNKVLRSFRVVTAVIKGSVTKAGVRAIPILLKFVQAETEVFRLGLVSHVSGLVIGTRAIVDINQCGNVLRHQLQNGGSRRHSSPLNPIAYTFIAFSS